MDYARIRDEERVKEYTYRLYVSDALKLMGENLAKAFGGEALGVRLYDLLERNTEPEDNRTGEEIIAEMRAKLAAMSEDEEDAETV